jgi:hypothetical protein
MTRSWPPDTSAWRTLTRSSVSVCVSASGISWLKSLIVSCYPFYSPEAALSNLSYTTTNMAHKYGKPIVVAETDWPVTCSACARPRLIRRADTVCHA